MAKGSSVNVRKYAGKYVTFDPATGKKIIASSSNPSTVIKKARRRGVDVPAIVFVPNKDTTCLY